MNKIEGLYLKLKQKYGNPKGQWTLWCKRPKTEDEKEEVIIGAILTQRTNWKNVEMALNNLKKAKLNTLCDIKKAGPEKIKNLIRPSGFYQAKANYLFGLAKFIKEKYKTVENMQGAETAQLRKELLSLKGIGSETADSILLYALEKPIFVIDEYTRRLIKKERLASKFSYEYLQKLFMENLKKDFCLFQDFHALIVIDGKNKTKTPSKPF